VTPRIAILGAGLTGLSAAYHLGRGYDVFEQAATAGGLCRSMHRGGFCFDYTGHLLHLRHEYTKALVHKLLPDGYNQLVRNAAIYVQNRLIPYPFQANLSGLPPEVIKTCILGFVNTLLEQGGAAPAISPPPRSFHDWVLETFGDGIARYFMFPYNRKLWRIPLEELSADWVSWAIPKPTLDEFLNGALGIQNRAFGYNPTFLYPKTGGAERLPQAFVSALPAERVHYQKKAVAIDEQQKRVDFDDQSSYAYDALISTLPLKHLIGLLRHAPAEVRQAAGRLRHVSVYDVNLGVKRSQISDKHWIYFPDPDLVFYRVGFPMNFSNAVAPAGCSSMYVEISTLPNHSLTEAALLDQVHDGLRRCGLLRANDEIMVQDVARIEYAYVLYDFNRIQALDTIFSYLRRHQIHSTGRYGAWEYASMETAILQGKQAAETLGREARLTGESACP
jgi:protoporphyrinogen oxidase